MKRDVGTFGATMTLVGLVVGISIFILPGTLAATAGPAVIASYALASFLTLFVCVVAAQIGCLFPVSGATFVAIGRLVSPFFGFVTVWMMIGGVCVAIALLGYGIADYLHQIVPGTNRAVAAYGIVLTLAVLNVVGMKANVIGQALMVVVFAVALVVFTAAGVMNVRADYLVPFAPNGWWPVAAAAIPAFFSFAGFMVIIDIGGEIRDPARTIPRALGLSFVIVLLTYVLVSLAVVGTIPWRELGGIAAPVGEAAARILPSWVAVAIAAAAVAAGATSINGLLLGYSRDVLALARVGIFPEALAKVSPRHGTPVNGVLSLTALALVGLSLESGVTELATTIAIALLTLQIFLGIAMLAAPRKLGALYEAAPFRLGRGALWFFGSGLILFSLAFLAIAVSDSPRSVLFAACHLLVGCGYYIARRRHLLERGTAMD
jgi:basic amino acid/polyamine antiporter, APA family